MYLHKKCDINEWAKRLIDSHRKPPKHLEIGGQKYFLRKHLQEETNLIDKHLRAITDALRLERVERRCGRAVAHWLSENCLAKVVKVSGIVNNYGFANKSGKYLHPEEAMFLIETVSPYSNTIQFIYNYVQNRLELFWNNVPLSIQQAYEILVSDIVKYVQYRKLSLQGYHLRINEDAEDDCEPVTKKTCIEWCKDECSDHLKELQKIGPQRFIPETHKIAAQYKIFSPENFNKETKHLNFYLSKSKDISPVIGSLDETILVGMEGLENSCLCYSSITLPVLN
ncbi:hypothetical protein FQA39_LY00002 [Lamprigera yunnana]|nr:hypothetical protein FQA39_LY00002 [Lamprigera yunnana]